MSGYKNFAIWGAGRQGSRIVNALLKNSSTSSVKVLTRPESKDKPEIQDLKANGAAIVPFDVSSTDAVAALKNIDVLISTTSGPGIPLQRTLIRAAHEAGVKLFVPAEWSMDSARGLAVDKLKESIREEATKVGLPIAAFWPGCWIDFLPMFGFDLPNGKITIRGDGEAELSMTTLDDVTSYTVHALTEFPRKTLEGGRFYIEADRVSFHNLALQLQKASSKPIEIVRTGCAELEEKVAANPDDRFSGFLLAWDQGHGVHQAELKNGLYPDWKPQSAFEALKPQLPV